MCAQRTLRSARASAQSDQSLRCPHEEILDPWLPIKCKRRLWSDLADAQANLSLRWAHSHFAGFDMSWLIYACKPISRKRKVLSLCQTFKQSFRTSYQRFTEVGRVCVCVGGGGTNLKLSIAVKDFFTSLNRQGTVKSFTWISFYGSSALATVDLAFIWMEFYVF